MTAIQQIKEMVENDKNEKEELLSKGKETKT